MAAVVEQEAKKVPILDDILDHEVLGREFKKGAHQEAVSTLRRLLEKRFGALPAWATENLAHRSVAELEELNVRAVDARSLEVLLR